MNLFCKKCRTKMAWAGHAEPPHLPRHGCGEQLEDWDARQRRHLVDAYRVMDASNISGVLLSTAKLMEEVCEEAPATPDRNFYLRTHPALVLFMDKVHDMMGRPSWSIGGDKEDRVGQAYRMAQNAILANVAVKAATAEADAQRLANPEGA